MYTVHLAVQRDIHTNNYPTQHVISQFASENSQRFTFPRPRWALAKKMAILTVKLRSISCTWVALATSTIISENISGVHYFRFPLLTLQVNDSLQGVHNFFQKA